MMDEKCAVNFETKISKHDNCICCACHDIARVIRIKLPESLYFDGKVLSTAYGEYWLCAPCREYWLCAPCRAKLSHALDWPEED